VNNAARDLAGVADTWTFKLNDMAQPLLIAPCWSFIEKSDTGCGLYTVVGKVRRAKRNCNLT
jgi:hypothetical protein